MGRWGQANAMVEARIEVNGGGLHVPKSQSCKTCRQLHRSVLLPQCKLVEASEGTLKVEL